MRMVGMCIMCGKIHNNRIFCSIKCKDIYHHKDMKTL